MTADRASEVKLRHPQAKEKVFNIAAYNKRYQDALWMSRKLLRIEKRHVSKIPRTLNLKPFGINVPSRNHHESERRIVGGFAAFLAEDP